MNKDKLNKVIGDGNIVIPLYILKNFKKFNLEMEEFMFLMYLYNGQDNLDFNPEKISNDLNIDIMEVMGYISILTDKGYVTLDVKKTRDNLIEEVINLNSFYDKISHIIINEQDEEVEVDSDNLFEYIENLLGRTINSIEIEMLDNWTNLYSLELIKEAFSIAINDGVYSVKYVDKILIDWSKRGIKTVSEINNNLSNENEELVTTPEIFDFDWLDDDSEYIIN